MQLYMSWYIRSFFGFTFLNILYVFKYSCTYIFHRPSLYTFYQVYQPDINLNHPESTCIFGGLLSSGVADKPKGECICKEFGLRASMISKTYSVLLAKNSIPVPVRSWGFTRGHSCLKYGVSDEDFCKVGIHGKNKFIFLMPGLMHGFDNYLLTPAWL